MQKWSLLTNHARTLLLVARDPDVRLRDLASELEVTERTAFGIVSDLTDAGYLVKEKNGRRNRYQIQTALPLAGAVGRRTIAEVLELLGESERAADRAGNGGRRPGLTGYSSSAPNPDTESFAVVPPST